jgi:hypothetical protein
MPTNIEKLAEQLAALDSLRAAGISMKVAHGERRIYFNLPYGHTFSYFEFDEIMPYDPSGAPGTTSDLCKDQDFQVFTDINLIPRNQAKRFNRELYTYLYFIFYDAAREGKLASPAMAATKFTAGDLRQRQDVLKRINAEFGGSHEAYLNSLDPAHGRYSQLPPFPREGVVDATSAQNVDQFLDEFVAKDDPALAAAIKADIQVKKGKKNAPRKKGSKGEKS